MTRDHLDVLLTRWNRERTDYLLLQSLFKQMNITKKRFAQLCGISDRLLRYKLSPDAPQMLTFAEWYLLKSLVNRSPSCRE